MFYDDPYFNTDMRPLHSQLTRDEIILSFCLISNILQSMSFAIDPELANLIDR